MPSNRTFTMIKPDAVEKGYIGAILSKINASGFRIVSMKMTQMSQRDAELFYAVHKERPFFNDLVSFISRGPIVAAVLEKENAVDDFRTLIGPPTPKKLQRVPFANSLLLQLEKMQYMVLTVMKTRRLKVLFISPLKKCFSGARFF